MGSQEEEAEDASVGQAAGIVIEVEADATLGYASIQNSVPVIRSLRLTNHGVDAIENR